MSDTPQDPGTSEQPEQPGTPPEPQPTAEITNDERLWAVLAHVSFFVLGIIAPLLIWLLHDRLLNRHSTFVEHHAKQATIYQIAALVITTVVAIPTCGIGAVIIIVFLVFPILAAIEANNGRMYTYPMMANIRAQGS